MNIRLKAELQTFYPLFPCFAWEQDQIYHLYKTHKHQAYLLMLYLKRNFILAHNLCKWYYNKIFNQVNQGSDAEKIMNSCYATLNR